MNGVPHERPAPAWWRQFWPWFLIALPAVSVVVSVTALVAAVRMPDPLVRDDYYAAGLAINRVRARERVAFDRHLRAEVRLEPDGGLGVTLTGAHADLEDALVLALAHPTQAERDRVLTVVRDGAGRFVAPGDLALAGAWDASLGPPDGAWRLAGRLVLGEGAPQVLGSAR